MRRMPGDEVTWLRSKFVRFGNWLAGIAECCNLVIKMEEQLYSANARNFMTACVRTPNGEKFEITLRRCEGRAVSEVLTDVRLEREIAYALLRDVLREGFDGAAARDARKLLEDVDKGALRS
jgi:hypothetical protein